MERKSDTIFLDTHIVVWLYEKLIDKISDNAKFLIEMCNVKISPMSILELQYLYEIKKINTANSEIISYLQAQINLQVDEIDFLNIINVASGIKWTRDPFDRIIVANALIHKAYLLSKDRLILDNYEFAII